jgi:regulator of protease activity HflC (stomatin/prohibitin superfamily)
MTEKIYTTKKNGMAVLLLTLLVLAAAVAVMVYGIINNVALMVVGLVVLCIGWLPLCGLKVLKPQEALVLTLFGDYKGTIREAGFYFVNPFCTAVNPAAATKLAQSGDIADAPRGALKGAAVPSSWSSVPGLYA